MPFNSTISVGQCMEREIVKELSSGAYEISHKFKKSCIVMRD
jgi:hypothetical protein